MRSFPPAWPKQPEVFTVVRQADELSLKEDLWLADAREFLRNCPDWPIADATSVQVEATPNELPRRLQSVNFLAWQKGQLTEHLRRKSEQTLVAAADLRELVTAVQRDALSIQAEEEALCKAEEELLLNRKRCAGELQQLWQELDLREMAFTDAALEVLEAPTAASELMQAAQLSEAVCDQAGDLQEETALLLDMHQDLETRDASQHCNEAAFGCLVERELTLDGLEELREGIAEHLQQALLLDDDAREAILTSLGGVGWTEGDLPATATSEFSGTAPSSARHSGRSTGSLKKVYASPRDLVETSKILRLSPQRPEDVYLEWDEAENLDDLDVLDVDLEMEQQYEDEEFGHQDYPNYTDGSLSAGDELIFEEEEEADAEDVDEEVDPDDLIEELEETNEFNEFNDAGEEPEELLPQRLDTLLGTVDSSSGVALPSDSCFIGVPAEANAKAPPMQCAIRSVTQVTRSSFPTKTSSFVPSVPAAPLAKFPVSYCPRQAMGPPQHQPLAGFVQMVMPKR
ncbi:unnamed protein product [Cladocopium goreaui]|uniref:Uncharacterized protein n=1 Tax=Cladocopium goreaui TaxID=2562237 RepID=A0A9P1DQZ8_9DINO|nr:unnamed protein product [Cladocopium goreaui]